MKIIILDRDGVINQDSDEFIKSPEEWIAIAGSLEAIARLNHSGYRVYIASNQSGIGRGLFDIETLNAIHGKMQTDMQKHGARIEAVLFCPHAPEDNCGCRKPKPGLYLDVAKRSNQSLKDVPIIGDSLRDLIAAKAVDANPILVKTGKGEQTLKQIPHNSLGEIACYDNLAQAVEAIINSTN